MGRVIDRRKDIDIAKALGIIMVVWAHASGPSSSYINQFHMPLFFFISGMLFKEPPDLKMYYVGKMKSLLIPFWICNYVLLLPFWVLYYWKNWSLFVLGRYVVEIATTVNKVPMLGATWFLTALFWVSVVFASLSEICDKIREGVKDVIILLSGIISCIIGMMITFPYRISRVLICGCFFVLGYLYTKYISVRLKNLVWKNIIAIIVLIGYIRIASINVVNMGSNEYKYKVLFVLGAIMAIYATLTLSEDISLLKTGWLSKLVSHLVYIGSNTLPIVIWQFVFFRITILMQIVIKKAPLSSLVSFPIYDGSGYWWLVYIVCGIYGSLAWNALIDWCKKKSTDEVLFWSSTDR